MNLSANNIYDLPPVSVIILTFNGAEYIVPLLDSIENQTYPRDLLEIIVVDNASTDDTVGLVRHTHPTVNLVPLKKNVGFAAGNNQGLLHASQDLLVFLNQDTICHPDFLASLVKVMLDDRTLAACNPNIITPDPPNMDAIDLQSPPMSLYVCDLSPYGYGTNRILSGKPLYDTKLLSGCAFIIRRETISKLGYLFDDQIWMYAEDTDLSLRIFNTGQRICAFRDSIIYHLHNANVNLNQKKLRLAAQAIMNRVYVFYKNMRTPEFLIYLPILLFGGCFKIFEFPLTTFRKFLFFLPYSLFSILCMGRALMGLPGFTSKRRRIISGRRGAGFSILKLVLKINA